MSFTNTVAQLVCWDACQSSGELSIYSVTFVLQGRWGYRRIIQAFNSNILTPEGWAPEGCSGCLVPQQVCALRLPCFIGLVTTSSRWISKVTLTETGWQRSFSMTQQHGGA